MISRTQKAADGRMPVAREMRTLYGLTLSVEHQLKRMRVVEARASDLFLLGHHEFE